MTDLTQAIRLEPTNSETLLLRGQVYDRLGEYEQAIADYGAALQIDVNQPLLFAQRILQSASRGQS